MTLMASLILLQFIIFVALIIMLRRIINKNVISATKHLEDLDRDYTKKENEINRRLEEVKLKSSELLTKAQEEAEKLKDQIIKETESERDKVLKQARTQSNEIIQQADKSKELLLSEVHERIAKEAIEKACELIQDTLPEQFRKDVHAHWMEELVESDFNRLERLPIPKDVKEVRITSAVGLSDKQRKILSQKLNNILGSKITIKEEVDPKVVAGVVITMGSLVFDGSLKNRIEEKVKNG